MQPDEERMSPRSAICVGEAVVELTRGSDGRYAPGSGGDTFNTAIYLARAGIATGFASVLSDDPYSGAILSLAVAEGVDTGLTLRVANRLPALALIEGGDRRQRHQWTETAPARELFELPGWGAIAEGLIAARLIYFSGITLSLYSNTGLGRFIAALEVARSNGARVAFDGNLRPHGWRGDLQRARTVFIEALKRVDIALPAYDDEAVLWGDPSPEATVARLQSFGVGEIVVKNGPNHALIATNGRTMEAPVPKVITPVDPTAAGDGFNAGYLAARLGGQVPVEAAMAAHRLAAEVIRHPGAIVPRAGAAMH
jgi:2-dehydro-3-deoxygluconokinase